MKKLALSILLIIGLLIPGFAQKKDVIFPIDTVTKKINFTEVIEQSGTKDQLFNKALEWFALHFKSANDVIQLKDKEAGKIIGNFVAGTGDNSLYVRVSVIIQCKDGKYKYSFTDLYYPGGSSYGSFKLEDEPSPFSVNLTKGSIRRIKASAFDSIQSSITDLKKYLSFAAKDDF